MAAGGIEIIKISEWMGHADIQTTMIYVQFVPRKKDQALMGGAYAAARDNGSVTAVNVARNLAAAL